MSNLQLTWSETELLATHPDLVPLVVSGQHFHGGFSAAGDYVSPRTRFRQPAIDAWKQSYQETFHTDLLAAPLDLWPASYPNVVQTRFLLTAGIIAPVVTQLTRIGTVEGFGAMIRHASLEDLPSYFADPIAGTALAHLHTGLFEAHALDEAGNDRAPGHKQMWFAIRDLAFDCPLTLDETELLMARLGLGGTASSAYASTKPVRVPVHPDLDPAFEELVRRLLSIFFIEISAYHTFAWAQEVLSDPELVANADMASLLVSCIRTDEAPHVEYLRCTLSEIHARTLRGTSGRPLSGAQIVDALWVQQLHESLGSRRQDLMRSTNAELKRTLEASPKRQEILAEFLALADPAT